MYRVGRLVWRVDRLGLSFDGVLLSFPRFRRVVPAVPFDPGGFSSGVVGAGWIDGPAGGLSGMTGTLFRSLRRFRRKRRPAGVLTM